jgi:hypothetical protein
MFRCTSRISFSDQCCDRLLPLPYQAQKAVEELSLFFYTNPTVSLRHIEDPHLKAAFSILGVGLPGRTTLGGPMLDKQYAAVVEGTMLKSFGGVLDAVAAGADDATDSYNLGKLPVLADSFALASDGWRRKTCAQGTPMINLMVIADAGPAVFLKVSRQRMWWHSCITVKASKWASAPTTCRHARAYCAMACVLYTMEHPRQSCLVHTHCSSALSCLEPWLQCSAVLFCVVHYVVLCAMLSVARTDASLRGVAQQGRRCPSEG